MGARMSPAGYPAKIPAFCREQPGSGATGPAKISGFLSEYETGNIQPSEAPGAKAADCSPVKTIERWANKSPHIRPLWMDCIIIFPDTFLSQGRNSSFYCPL